MGGRERGGEEVGGIRRMCGNWEEVRGIWRSQSFLIRNQWSNQKSLVEAEINGPNRSQWSKETNEDRLSRVNLCA